MVLPESTGGDGAIRAAATGPAVWSGKGKRSPKTVVRADSQTQAAGAAADASPTSVEVELLRQCVEDYEDVNTMLLSKVKKLETLLKLKDKRIGNLERLCTKNGLKTVCYFLYLTRFAVYDVVVAMVCMHVMLYTAHG